MANDNNGSTEHKIKVEFSGPPATGDGGEDLTFSAADVKRREEAAAAKAREDAKLEFEAEQREKFAKQAEQADKDFIETRIKAKALPPARRDFALQLLSAARLFCAQDEAPAALQFTAADGSREERTLHAELRQLLEQQGTSGLFSQHAPRSADALDASEGEMNFSSEVDKLAWLKQQVKDKKALNLEHADVALRHAQRARISFSQAADDTASHFEASGSAGEGK